MSRSLPGRLTALVFLVAVFALPSEGGASRTQGEGSHNPSMDRRVVDVVRVGDGSSEAGHGFAHYMSEAFRDNAGSYRLVTGWVHYSLAVFEDTEVTVAIGISKDSRIAGVDLVVEDSLLRISRDASSTEPVVQRVRVQELPGYSWELWEIDIPSSLTLGKSSITVVLRARDDRALPLREVRTVQFHNEFLQQAGLRCEDLL